MEGPSEAQASPSFAPAEQQALAAFNHAAEELRFFKSQQWSVTNYALLAYAALAAAPEGMETWKVYANVACAVLVVFAAGVAAGVLWSLERALEKERKRIHRARLKLPLVEAIHTEFPPKWTYTPGVLYSAVVIGALLAISINLSREGVVAWVCSWVV